MQKDDKYIVKTNACIGIISIVKIIDPYVKIKWKTGQEEWVMKEDFKSHHSYIDPKIKIIEKIIE